MRISQLVAVGNEKLIVLACLSGLVLLTAGCASSKKEVGLLGPRPLTVPPAYSEPVPAVPAPQVIPPEPVLADPGAAAAAAVVKETVEPAPKSIVLPPKVASKLLTYKVAPNDSIWKIAWMYNVSPEELAAANKLKLKESVKIGQVLNIPPGGHYVPLSKRPMPKPKVVAKKPTVVKAAAAKEGGQAPTAEAIPAGGKYKVQKNDNLWIIARKFNVHSVDIRKVNNLTSDALQIGQELIIPQDDTATAAAATTAEPGTSTEPASPPTDTAVPAATVTPPAVPVTTEVAAPPPAGTTVTATAASPAAAAFPNSLEHTILEGETLESIAEMYETKVDDILKANPLIKSNSDLKPNLSIMVHYK